MNDATRPEERRIGWTARSAAAIWLLAFAFYAITGTGHCASSDGILIFLTARNFFHSGALSVPPLAGTETSRKTGVDGKDYIKYAPGLVLAHLPMLAVSQVAKHFPILSMPSGETPSGRRQDEFWVQLTSSWLAASAITLLALAVTHLGGSRRDAWLVCLLVGLGSPLWLYARADSTETLQALSLIGAFYTLWRAPAGSLAGPGLAGAFCGLNILAKTFNVLLIPLFLGYQIARSRRPAAIGAFLVPVGAALLMTGLYNQVRFGSPLDAGYDLATERFDAPLVPGVIKLLFSPSYGLLAFFPGSVLALLGLRSSWRAARAETLLVLGIFLSLLVLYARWWAFSGFGWGPRFLIPALPLLGLLMVPAVASARRATRILVLALLVLGTAVQALAATTSHWQQVLFGVYGELGCLPETGCLDDPRVAPLRIAWWRVRGAEIRARHPDRFAAHVEAAPWREAYPWIAPEGVATRQWVNTGLDFWAVPAAWRLERYYLWLPGEGAPTPRSMPLAGLLLVVSGGSLIAIRRILRSGGEGT